MRYKEALRYKGGIIGTIVRLISNLHIGKISFSKHTKYLENGLFEVLTLPISCVMFKRKALFNAGLFDARAATGSYKDQSTSQ